MELFTHAAGIQLRHIPTAGGGPALTALLGGHVDCSSIGPNVAIPQVKAGALRVLAGWGDKRLRCPARHPHAQGTRIQGRRILHLVRLFAPRATPPAAIKVLREATRKAVNTPEFKTALEKMETPITYLDADDFQKFWDTDAKRLIQGVRT